MPNAVVFALSGGTSTGILSSDMVSAFSDAFSGIKADVTTMVTTALPIGLGIMGLFLAIRLGINFFRSIAN